MKEEKNLTSPRRTRKDYHVLIPCEPIHHFEAITCQPEDFPCHTVDFRIVLCALHRLCVFFNREDAVPAAGARERNGVAAYASESIDNDSFVFGRGLSYVCGDFAGKGWR